MSNIYLNAGMNVRIFPSLDQSYKTTGKSIEEIKKGLEKF